MFRARTLPVVQFFIVLCSTSTYALQDLASVQDYQDTALQIDNQTLQNPFDFQFPLLQNANSTALFPMRSCNGITLEEATIDQLQDYMSHGRLTAEKIVRCYVERNYQVDEFCKYV